MKRTFKMIASFCAIAIALLVLPITCFAAATPEKPIIITPPDTVIKPVDGVYTTTFGVETYYDIEEMRFAEGQLGLSDYDNAQTVTSTTFNIPAEESDKWYTFYVKDVNGNMNMTQFYAHCEEEPDCVEDPEKHIVKNENGDCVCEDGYTMDENGVCQKDETEIVTLAPPAATQTPTPVPETPGCPDGQTMDANGNCYTPNTACPDGYIKNQDGTCVPAPVDCPEGQALDVNGNCVDKVTSLPQTGGLDSLMLLFLFGCGLGVCGIGVLAYSKKK